MPATASRKGLRVFDVGELKEEALESAEWRGHDMGGWNSYKAPYCECVKCGAFVQVDSSPAPNGIDIGGDAVAINCPEVK